MLNLDPKKQKRLMIWTSVIIAAIFLAVIIIHFDKFEVFFSLIGDKLTILNPVFVGIIIAYLLNPIEKFFIKKVFKKVKSNKAHKALSILCTYVLVIGLISTFLLIAVPQIVVSINEMPEKLRDFAIDATALLEKYLTNFENSEFFVSIMNAFDIESIDIEKIVKDFATDLVSIEQFLQTVADSSLGIIESVYTTLKDLVIGFILSIYLLAAKERLLAMCKKIIIALFGKEKGDNTLGIFKFTNNTFGGFIQGKLINAVIIGILTWLAFVIFGVPYPQLLAIIIAITDLIPVFGPFIGAIPSAFIVLIAAPEKLIIMILLIIVIQQIDGNYIGPKILGESTGLSALGVFLAIIIMGGYFGIPGMLLGVLIFAVISALIQRSVDKKLTKDGQSTDITEYYSKHSLEDDEDHKHNSLFKRIVDFFAKYIKIIVLAVIRFFKKLPKIRKKQDPTSIKKTEKDNEKHE
jgi:predicted PurR-regulated permease PerM